MEKPESLTALGGKKGKEFWRSLEDLADDKLVQDYVKHEFPQSGSFWDRPMTRRTFLKLMGSQIIMLLLAGCSRQLPGKIVPYVKSPENIVPGEALYFATALNLMGSARGVLVESHLGRPTKIEGNPQHPDSLGRTDAITQAMLYQLYDPDRSGTVMDGLMPSAWGLFQLAMAPRIKQLREQHGRGLRFLSGPIISPALASQRRKITREYPQARWHQYTPLHHDPFRRAAIDVYGKNLNPDYNFKKADVVLAVESDFLNQGPGAMRHAHDFSERRQMHAGPPDLNRLYALEATPTLTGTMADHRIVIAPRQTEIFMGLLCKNFGIEGTIEGHLSTSQMEFLSAITDDLREHQGRSLVIAGPQQSQSIHQMALQLNHALRNTGKTVHYHAPLEEDDEDMTHSLQELVHDLHNGTVTDLVILNANPVYNSPRDFQFLKAFHKAHFRVHLGLYQDETAKESHWHIPQAHELESWGDTKAFNGTISIRQPLIAPLYNGITEYEMAGLFLGQEGLTPLEIIRSYWEKRSPHADFDFFWDKTIHDGVMEGNTSEALSVSPQQAHVSIREKDREGLTLLIRPDPYILDGQFANSSLLQELPKPLTRLTWDNAALIAPLTAEHLDVHNGEVIEISHQDASIEAPVWVLPGQAADVVTIHLGYGRQYAGTIGSGIGFNAYNLQNSSSPHELKDIRIRKTGRSMNLATTQHHGMLDSRRHPVMAAALSEYTKDPQLISSQRNTPGPRETLYEPGEHLHGEYQWGMLIDLNRCMGCGACTMACQVENNIPTVGKEQVENHREMHWIRVDRYYKGSHDNPQTFHQPVPCMQCENAPCEVVCPVEATTHSEEGLNEMTYNRCIGTRYCSNNCPYKVRRFNFYEFSKRQQTTSLHLGQNPDVTVRARGVMEKCTYCVQRINKARIDAKKENRLIRDGEIVPACQQACPAGAIIFGNVADANSMVSRAKNSPLNYGLLEELGTRPRTSYLAKITNPNPRLAGL